MADDRLLLAVLIDADNVPAAHAEAIMKEIASLGEPALRREILDKTDLADDQIGEYSGESKAILPVTLATYQIITYRKRKGEDFPHFGLFNARSWGLILYDEVHLLPAPVFRVTAEIQARRRLGLTATLVREDGRIAVLDFGLARVAGPDEPGGVCGTPGYIAPEVWRGETPTPAADWFAVGAIIFSIIERENYSFHLE